ncbi:MAG: KEOPS complex subunit Cgi121 [Candidatus Thermoplasmatota archaeon]|nr:KEOPS complex subunit Cgi121 [Candidatus Thermoplasmatota archaeon]
MPIIMKVECAGIKDVEELLKKIESIEQEEKVRIIALDEHVLSGEDQIKAAIMHAERNFSKGKNVARDFKTEVMRYIACERQIKDAIKKAGIKKGAKSFVLVLLGLADSAREEKILNALGLKKSGFIKEKRDKVDEALESMALLEL